MRPLELKDQTGRVCIGKMKPNPALSRLEVELDEPTFLRHAKAIAQAGRFSGATVFVAEVRDDGVAETHPHPLPSSSISDAVESATRDLPQSENRKEDDHEEEEEDEVRRKTPAHSTDCTATTATTTTERRKTK